MCIVVWLFMRSGVGGVLNYSGSRKTHVLLTWSPDSLTQWLVCLPAAPMHRHVFYLALILPRLDQLSTLSKKSNLERSRREPSTSVNCTASCCARFAY